MEKNNISTNFSDSDSEKRIEYLEDELARINAKVALLEELLMLAEGLLSRCTCSELKEQIVPLLSSVRRALPKVDDVLDSPTIPDTRRIDAATQCDGGCFFDWC